MKRFLLGLLVVLPFMSFGQNGANEFKQKKTFVTVTVTKDGVESVGVGTAKMNVAATLLQLQDENLPFEQTEFSVAVKRAIEDALD
jgi:hypothetical protein